MTDTVDMAANPGRTRDVLDRLHVRRNRRQPPLAFAAAHAGSGSLAEVVLAFAPGWAGTFGGLLTAAENVHSSPA